ncbi:MAG TPA: NAD(P)-dependent oxidoreductase [Beutenbergiaceae bacterium]|nr:NAD(P)-dependent oxidoreductase [Beutenbergiaceae bacterium]
MSTTSSPYRLGISAEFFKEDGQPIYPDIGIGDLEAMGVAWRALESADLADVEGISDLDGLLVLRQRIGADELALMPRLRHIARWGAGLDRIDLEACADRGVVVTTTPEGGRRPVASAALALLLALAHEIPRRDQLVRSGRWADRTEVLGVGLAEMTVGIIGLGTIGSEFVRLIKPFGATLIAAQERTDRANAADLGVQLMPTQEVLKAADAVVLMCPLTEETRGVISAEALALMKPSAVLVNVARGELIDEAALAIALRDGSLRAAGLDVFQTEPLPTTSPLIDLSNVILAPHSLAWGSEILDGNRIQAMGEIRRMVAGERPVAVANPRAIEHPSWAPEDAS